MTGMHEEYDPNPVAKYQTYCPACMRSVRCGSIKGVVTFWRHYLNASYSGDRCVNSRQPVAEAFFRRVDNRIVKRADWEATS